MFCQIACLRLERRYSCIGCICLTFLHCVFSNVSSNRLPEWMQSHTGCICLAFLQCGLSNVSSNGLHEKMHNHTSCNCLIFPFVHWQLFHWCSSAWNDQAQEFVQSPQVGKLCHQNQDLLVRPGYNFAQLFRDLKLLPTLYPNRTIRSLFFFRDAKVKVQ